MFAIPFAAPVRPSAARAAHRELRSLLRLFRASYAWGICARPLGAWHDIAPYEQGGRARLSQASLARNKRRYSVGGQAFLRCSELKSLAVSNGSSPLMHAQMPVRYLRMTAAIACIFFLPLLISDS